MTTAPAINWNRLDQIELSKLAVDPDKALAAEAEAEQERRKVAGHGRTASLFSRDTEESEG